MEFYIAQGISVLTCILAVVISQFKDMRGILAGRILTNLLSATTYLLLGGLSGAGVCLIAIVHTVIMYIYNEKKIPPHKSVIVLFVTLYVACSAVYYSSPVDIISGVAAVCFALSVVQTKPSCSRLWFVFNPLLWLIYDVFTRAYGNMVLHVIIFISTLAAIIRYDVRKKSDE